MQVCVQKGLNAHVGRTQVLAQHQVLLVVAAQERSNGFEQQGVGGGARGGLPERGQLQIQIAGEFGSTP